MDVKSAGDDPPAAAMADLAGEAAMALSGLSALLGPSSAEPGPSPFQSANSPLETLASIDLNEYKEVSPATNPLSDANVILSASAALSLETRSTSTPSEEDDDVGDMDDDIAGLLNLTQAVANMRPVKRISSDRALKHSGGKVKAKKEHRVKIRVAPQAKTKQLKAAKPVKGVKAKTLSLRRLGELGSKGDKEKVRSMDIGAESDGEATPHMEASEFGALFETILREAESNARDIRKSKATSAEVYGEVLPLFVEQLCERLDLKGSDVFFDLGSGTGNVVCQVASQVGCRCYGVEIRADLHTIAERVYEGVKREMGRRGRRMGHIHLTNADALTQPMMLVDATVVFLNNISFPESMQGPLEHFFTETLPHGSRLVTMKEMFPRGHGTSSHEKRSSRSFATLFKHPCEVFEATPGSVTWTSEPFSFFVYTVDREAWAAVTFAINRPSHISSYDSPRNAASQNAKQDKTSPRPKKSALLSSSLPSTSSSSSPFKAPSSSSSIPPFSLQSPFQNPHARFCLHPNHSYPDAVKTFVTSLDTHDIGHPVISSTWTPSFLSSTTEPFDHSASFTSTDASDSSTTSCASNEITFAIETYESMRMSPANDYCTNAAHLSAVVGSELANPGVSVNDILSRLEARYSLTSHSHDFQIAHQQDLLDLYHSTEVDRMIALDVLAVDRRLRMGAKKARELRSAKLSEIATLNVNARQLDESWQRDWISTDLLRKQLAEREEKLEILAKQRHAAIQQLNQLIEDETDETLNYNDPNNFLRRKPLILPTLPTLNAMDFEPSLVAELPVSSPSHSTDISLQSIKDFLSSGNQFMDEHGIEMPGPKKIGGRLTKIDRRFGPRPKKPIASGSNSLAASTSSNPKHGLPADREEEASKIVRDLSSSPRSPGTVGDDHVDVSPDATNFAVDQGLKMDVDSEVDAVLDLVSDHHLGIHAPLKRKEGALSGHSSFVDTSGPLVSMGDYLRASRPRRVVTMTAPPQNEPTRRVKKPGQKSLDRKQLKASLMNSLLSSPDGKLSIVELRQACKDLPPFRDLREKQIERKVWDALSKAQDQFKHALPTPAERKAHAMGAGKAGLWSLNPRWRPNQPNDRDISSEESDDDDDGTQDDEADFDENDLPPVIYKPNLNRKRLRIETYRDSTSDPAPSKTTSSPRWDETATSPPSSKKFASADSFPPPESPVDSNSAVHSLAFLASAMESLSE